MGIGPVGIPPLPMLGPVHACDCSHKVVSYEAGYVVEQFSDCWQHSYRTRAEFLVPQLQGQTEIEYTIRG